MKTMKKTLAILLAALLTFALVIPAAADGDAGTISVTSISSARAGETVTVTLSLQNNPGLYSAMVRVTYDDTALELVSVADCGLFGIHADAMLTTGTEVAAQEYRVLWDCGSTTPVTANGDLMTLTFKIADTAPAGTYAFAVTCIAANTLTAGTDPMDLNSYDLGAANGSVTVARIAGDADGDGEVTLRDAVLIRRYKAGWSVVIDLSSADVDADSEVTLADVAAIKRYLVGGWNVTLL